MTDRKKNDDQFPGAHRQIMGPDDIWSTRKSLERKMRLVHLAFAICVGIGFGLAAQKFAIDLTTTLSMLVLVFCAWGMGLAIGWHTSNDIK